MSPGVKKAVSATTKRPAVPAGIKSVENGARLLNALAVSPGPMRLADIAVATGMTRSMARGYLVSLLRSDLVAQDPDNSTYDLGPAALRLGLAALGRIDVMKLARVALAGLAEKLGETAALAVWSDNGPVTVAAIESPETSMYEFRVGAIANLMTTATGRVFLAWKKPSDWQPVLERTVVKGGRHPTAAEVQRVIKEVRGSGIAMIDAAPGMPHFAGAAAPVFDHEGELRCALVVVGRFDEPPARRSRVAAELLQVATQLSGRLGHRTDGEKT